MFPLGQMPSFEYTEEMRKQAMKDAIQKAGFSMMAASLNGEKTGNALGQGLLGGFQSFQQAPQVAQKQFQSELDAKKDWLGMNKTAAELQKLSREEGEATKQKDFYAMLNNPGRAALAGGGGPSLANFNAGQRYQNDPASMLADPKINMQALQVGVDPKRLGSAMENTRPFKLDAGAMYQHSDGRREQIPQAQPGMTVRQLPDGSYTAVPITGFNSIVGNQELNREMGKRNAQLYYDSQSRDNTVVNQPMSDGSSVPVTANEQLNFARSQGNAVLRVPPEIQAQRDSVRREILKSEGADPNMPTRLNDRADTVGIRPQVAGLTVGSQSPANQAQATDISKGFAKVYETLREKATDTSSLAGKYRQINQLLGDFEGGKLSPLMTDIASSANSLGFQIDKKLPNKEAARNIVATMMGDFKSMLPGAMSDADRRFLMSIPPSEANSASGRAKILAIQEKLAERSVEEHQIANRWIQKHGRLTPEFEQQLNNWRRSTRMFATEGK
jgi:hypothetical protein